MASRWTNDEDEILRANYCSMVCIELQKMLPNRSMDAIRKRAKVLKLVKYPMWTKDEEDILKAMYPIIGGSVSTLLPNHSRDACTDKANRMGLKHKCADWTNNEDEILRNNYYKMGRDVYKLLPGRTITACADRAKHLGLKVKRRSTNKSWTKNEDKVLIKFYPIIGPDVCFKLPNRTRDACAKRARSLGLRKGKY